MQTLLHNARIFDGVNGECLEGMSVLIEEGVIREVSDKPIKADAAQRFDVAGKTLMPGLGDGGSARWRSALSRGLDRRRRGRRGRISLRPDLVSKDPSNWNGVMQS